MHSAASGGNVEIIKKLKDAESDANLVHIKDSDKKTPLHVAARCGNSGAVECLMCIHGQPTDEIDFMDEAIDNGHKYDSCSMHMWYKL